MSLHKLSPVIQTLLVFLLMQGVGTAALFGIGIFLSPEFASALRGFASGTTDELPLFAALPVSFFALTLMATNILAVTACHFVLHSIRLGSAFDVSSVRWQPGMLALLGGIFGAIGMSVVTDSVEMPDSMQQATQALSRNMWGLLALVVVGPVTEELLFREAIAGEMLRRGAAPWAAILASALSFSIVHLNLAQGIYALPLGILFGVIYCKTGNIVLTSMLHILNNGIVVLLLCVSGGDYADASYAEWFGGMAIPYVIMTLSFVLCGVLMYVFLHCYKPRV